MPTATLAVTVGAGLANVQGELHELPDGRAPALSLQALLDALPPERPESWVSPHVWEGNARAATSSWLSSAGVFVDVDCCLERVDETTGAIRREKTERKEIFGQLLKKLVGEKRLAGSWIYATPNGFRFGFMLDAQCSSRPHWLKAAKGAAELVRRTLRAAGIPEPSVGSAGLEVDEKATLDQKRLFWAPCTVVGGKARKSPVTVLREEPYTIHELAAHEAAKEAPPQAQEPASAQPAANGTSEPQGPAAGAPAPSRARSTDDLETAIARWNLDHARSYPVQPGECPICKHKDCFHALKGSSNRWFCFSSGHPKECGRAKESGHFGDALDLDAFTAGRVGLDGRVEHLRAERYLRKPSLGRPPATPGPEIGTAVLRSPKGREEALERTGCTHLANAERFVAASGPDFRYDVDRKRWRLWNTRCWGVDRELAAQRRMLDVCQRIYQEAANAETKERRQALASWAARSENAQQLNSSLEVARCLEGMPVIRERLDSDPWAFNAQNGTIDLHTGKLRPHRRADMLTRCAPVTFDPKAECPLWLDFLGQIFKGDHALIQFMQRFAGYSLTGDTSEEKLLLLHGSGQNGKSTLLGVLQAILGDDKDGYSHQAAFSTFVEQRTDRARWEIAHLDGPRLVCAIETDDHARIDEALIKALTGRDRLRGERKYEASFEFTPECKIWLAANHEPRIQGGNKAIWRRILKVPFLVEIPEKDRDPDLRAKLLAEGPGILNWMIEGCIAWQAARGTGKDGLAIPQGVVKATADYRETEDVLGAFISSCCDVGHAYTVKSGELFETFIRWAKASAMPAMSTQKFGRRMSEHRFEGDKEAKGVRIWLGLQLRADLDLPSHDGGSSADAWWNRGEH